MGISTSRHMHKRGQGSSPEEEPPAKLPKLEAAHCEAPSSSGGGDPHALLDPALIALREELAAVVGPPAPLLTWAYCPDTWERPDGAVGDPRADDVVSRLLDLRLIGSGAEGLPEAVTSRVHFAQVSGYFRNAVEFGDPGTQLHLDIGHMGVLLLLDAVHAPESLELTLFSAVDLLQAALYLQVDSVIKEVLTQLAFKLPHQLYPALLRLPAVQEDEELVSEICQKVEQLLTKVPWKKLVPVLAALPQRELQSILDDDRHQSPARCQVLQMLCKIAKVNEQVATNYVSNSCFWNMSYGELEACGLYLQTQPDLPLAFASAAMLRIIAAMASCEPSQMLHPHTLNDGCPEQVLAAWVPCEGSRAEEVVLIAPKGWKIEYNNCIDLMRFELAVTPADAQVPGSEMAVRLRPLSEGWHGWHYSRPYLPVGFSMTVFAFTTAGFRMGRLGPLVFGSEGLYDTAFLSKVSGAAFVCPDGRRRLLVGVEG